MKTYPTATGDDGGRFNKAAARSAAVQTRMRSICVITSPACKPAFSATLPRATPVISTPTFARFATTIPSAGIRDTAPPAEMIGACQERPSLLQGLASRRVGWEVNSPHIFAKSPLHPSSRACSSAKGPCDRCRMITLLAQIEIARPRATVSA
jgi:hypothetical protein